MTNPSWSTRDYLYGNGWSFVEILLENRPDSSTVHSLSRTSIIGSWSLNINRNIWTLFVIGSTSVVRLSVGYPRWERWCGIYPAIFNFNAVNLTFNRAFSQLSDSWFWNLFASDVGSSYRCGLWYVEIVTKQKDNDNGVIMFTGVKMCLRQILSVVCFSYMSTLHISTVINYSYI